MCGFIEQLMSTVILFPFNNRMMGNLEMVHQLYAWSVFLEFLVIVAGWYVVYMMTKMVSFLLIFLMFGKSNEILKCKISFYGIKQTLNFAFK